MHKQDSELKSYRFLFSIPELSDFELEDRDFEVLKVGEYYDQRYGKFSIDEKLLCQIKDNFEKNVLGVDVALDENHKPEKGAFAWVKSLEVRNGSLFARLKDFTSKGKEMLKEKVFKYFSVEFAPFEKVEGGKKVTIPNVLRGIALTNRPVIKGMQPALFSEGSLSINPNDMSLFKKFADGLLGRSKVSKDDVTLLKSMFSELSDEEKAEVAPKVEEVEAKVEEAKAEGEEVKADEAPAEAPKAVEAAEMSAKFAEMSKELSELRRREHDRVVNDHVASLMLSEAGKAGFANVSDNVTSLKGFVASLSEDQVAQFKALMGKVTLLSEEQAKVHGGRGVDMASDEAKHAEVKKLSEGFVKEGMREHEAIAKAQKMVFAS